MITKSSTITTAKCSFDCPACGTLVKIGATIIDDGDVRTCLCVLPARRLRATGVRRLVIK